MWKQEQQTAFDSFKQTIISYPVPRERQYKTIEKECLVIVRAVSVLREYLEGREFIIETDYFPLQWLNKMKGKNQRLSRWSLLLQGLKLKIHRIKGKDNKVADGSSRMFDI